jgi:hypothetical protein
VFPIGATTVTCVGLDGSGNQATCSFPVVVEGTGSGIVIEPAGELAFEAVRPRRKVRRAPRQTTTLTIRNAGCQSETVTLRGFERVSPLTGISDPIDTAFFRVSGMAPGQPVTLRPGAPPLVVRVTFVSAIPRVATGTSGLSANDVLPADFTDRMLFETSRGLMTVLVRAGATTRAQSFGETGFVRSGGNATVSVNLYDSNLDVERAVYQFSDGSGQAVGGPIEVSLAGLLGHLVPGQSFNLAQAFTNVPSRVTRVRVTVYDGEGSIQTGLVATGSAGKREPDLEGGSAMVVLSPRRFAAN